MAGSGCGDDASGGDSTGTTMDVPSTGTASADDAPPPDPSTSTGDDPTSTTTPADSSSGSGSGSGGDSTTEDGASGSSSGGSESGDSSSSGTTGGPINVQCQACGDDEVCVANQAQQTSYECQPMPKSCAGDVDCECGESLCVAPYVGCFDPPEDNILYCACIAC